jgi:hypothetical protein
MIAGRVGDPSLFSVTINSGITNTLSELADWSVLYATGEILIAETSGEALVKTQVVYMDRTTRKWFRAGASNGGSVWLLGVVLNDTGGADQTIQVLLHGFYSTESHDQFGSESAAKPLYISDTVAGNVSENVPTTSGYIARLVGHCYWESATQTNGACIIRFNPDNTWVVI